MVRPRKSVAKKSRRGRPPKATIKTPENFADVDYIELVDIVRKSRRKTRIDEAYRQIEKRMRTKLQQISFKFYIPGMSNDDIYQESLYALRYKAIKDYDKTRGSTDEPYPFDKFAILCIRRHLATNLKASYQNKKKVLNQSISLDQERNESSQDFLFLSDILPLTDSNILDDLERKEYYTRLFTALFKKLSDFERQVLILYAKKYSYEEIAEKVNKMRKKKNLYKISTKSIDNSLSRTKSKARIIFAHLGGK
tara:strand:- start:2688 stop:3443 length:756 start_codon:yes stop_codon:yes gene_type:complete